jgi:hypothetical protein
LKKGSRGTHFPFCLKDVKDDKGKDLQFPTLGRCDVLS